MANLLDSISLATSALGAQSERLNTISQNIANADTPGYKRKQIVFSETLQMRGGAPKVEAKALFLDRSDGKRILDPQHPLSNEEGYYEGSNINLMVEIADSKEAQRSYEANIRVFENAKQMTRSLIDIIRK